MNNVECGKPNYSENSVIEEEKDNEIKDVITLIIDEGVEDISVIVQKFNNIYQCNYRHKYSQILKLLMEIEDESLDYLVLNMNILKEHISTSEYVFKKSFLKLYDHIMLEVTRIRLYHDYEKREKSIESKVNTAKSELEYYRDLYNNLNTDINNLYTTVNNVNEQLQNSNAQFISILGIFSGIVIAFFGSIKVTENIFSNLGKDISKYRIIFMAALVGFILFNTIFILLYFIAKISNKNIATNSLDKYYNRCYEWDGEEGQWKENRKAIKKYRRILKYPIKRLKIRYPIVFWTNSFIVLVMIMSVVVWIMQNQTIFKISLRL
ncbi:hypothetical protein RSJ22_11970 [Clostridium botulinum]|uniref:Uncharacterized protein n=2 Tax=Clostridium botulinum TaxID=1491 RepID=A0A846HWS5_CLOBO|nr:hypothetical protein [Clostridium botulinum]APQ73651.1 hypothetical protein RSJ9_2655 [Clostridium botulinum]AUN22118.1 hypothetical protein RSJ22_11970 [Clostridium botulinum]EJO5348922.1 hypothetical protein [Clostridium botulinum]MBY6878903.1 hypothetical protein [Clostridium botulinum]NEZ91933.1 hypothetical protein [Clostridium botulinum]